MIQHPRAPGRPPDVRSLSDEHRKPWLVVSDLHLGAVPPETEAAFHDFVREAESTAAGLLINGDLFDLWYSYRFFVPRQHVRTLTVLADAVAAGLRIVLVGGNRDAIEWDSGALREDVKLELYSGPVELRLGPWTALVAHGDGVRPSGSGTTTRAPGAYRHRFWMLRHPALVWAAKHLLPPDAVAGIMERFSGTPKWVARHARGESTGPKRAAPGLERWARAMLTGQPSLDLVLAGHSHLPAQVEVTPGRFYVNSGDWLSHYSYLVLPPDRSTPEVRVWPSRRPIDWATVDDGSVRGASRQDGRMPAGEGAQRRSIAGATDAGTPR